ncbi:hypothetical protein [Haladaptatus sp. AB643]|uniref:hypothetical protein n=1 Tax=Haladaptatus sp. AB643 TaxID=2934174 RepID=UPI00209C5F9D|nr:hypothetical protein [Haladaptatus sp. AB643]MCO8242992.1 hypothetical protein [Haladaptatus sp. AB643]
MAEEAFAYLHAHFGPDESFTYGQATQVLQTNDIEHLLADDLLETLLLRGYLYEVDDRLRITE